MFRHAMPLMLTLCLVPLAWADEPAANVWRQVSEDQVGPRYAPGLVCSESLGRFVLFGGTVSHAFTGERPYDVQTFDVDKGEWFNHLPPGAEKRGGATGNVTAAKYKSPYFSMTDEDGLVAPSLRQMALWYQYALAPWDGCVYALSCGHVLRYDPAKREWKDTEAPVGPMPLARTTRESLSWAAMCADPVNREIVLFGGCGVATATGGPGTWVYSPEANTWKKLELQAEPPGRALSPMVFDPTTKKIVLFGGDHLDYLHGDTWVYDCATRTWEQRRPAVSPSPRFGHAMLFLPKSKKLLLVGGKGYRHSTSYTAMLYQPLPFEMWTYDVAADRWELIQHLEEGGPRLGPVTPAVAAADTQDRVLLVGAGTKNRSPHSSWLCTVDPGTPDAAGAAKYAVLPGTIATREGPYDPAWYTADVPPVDKDATAKVLDTLPANRWVALKCPKWPFDRMGGGWSTVSLDTDADRILHLGGGHSSYFGNDVAIYDIATGRWSISYAPMFALEFNYDLSGPGPYALNLGPWGNHNYHAYCYDPTSKRLVYMKNGVQLFDPATNSWPFDEKFAAPFTVTKYTTYMVPTPRGPVAWTHEDNMYVPPMGLYRLEGGKKWARLKVSGEALPETLTDGSAAAYDSKRDRLVMVTGKSGKQPTGQVWTYDFATGVCAMQNPAGMEAFDVKRHAREAVYLPRADMVLLGLRLQVAGKAVMPLYDCKENRWLAAEIAGSEFIAKETGASVDLGLVYDPKRDLVWGVLCSLRDTGALNVLRLDAEALKAEPLK